MASAIETKLLNTEMGKVTVTREEYMTSELHAVGKKNGKELHHCYYRQFVTPSLINFVVNHFGDRLVEGWDELFGDRHIPIKEWDRISHAILTIAGPLLAQADSVYRTTSTAACVGKTAVRIHLSKE